ncbi:histidine kinase N-terminal 7TM domain-containing protein [Halorubrum sp. SY-15]|uniref:histidine kinase N-terminal 7TM domain-containing protein n=1 Tax=Halorubrum sp. SY-15 TaxID=3402277 RepID=UPI003EB850C4
MSIPPFDVILFGVPALISAGVASSAWRHRADPGGMSLVLHGLGSAVWILSYGAGTRLDDQLIVSGMLGVSWLSAVIVAFSGMYVAAEYTERMWLKRPVGLGIAGGYVCLEALLIAFNPADLFYTRTPTVVQGGPPVYEFGVWWTVHLIVTFAAAAAMLGMFLEAYSAQRGGYRRQARAIVAGIVVSYVTLIVEVAGLEPYPDLLYNATMAGSTVLSVTFLWALFYADFLKVTPIAHRTLLADIEDAAIVLDHRDRLVYANQAVKDVFGVDPKDTGTSADDLFDSIAGERPDRVRDMAGSEVTVATTPDGERRCFSVSVSAVGDDERGRAFVFHEITAQKQHERLVERQRDNLETLNQVLRHDIRNDLQLITAYTDFLDDECETADSQRYVDTISESADHAVELTQTARELSAVMLSTGVEEQRVALRTMLINEVTDVRASYPDATFEFGTEIPSITLTATEMISSVFRNLLKNAVQHNDKDAAEVTVSATDREGAVTVTVADNGPGVPDDQKETIFGKGERGLDSSGSGIGLHLVNTLVDVHDGDVWVEDNDPVGARFVVELPTT